MPHVWIEDQPISAAVTSGGTIPITGTVQVVSGGTLPVNATSAIAIAGNGPSGKVVISADANGKLYTVLADASVVLSSNMYGYNGTLSSWKPAQMDGSTNAQVAIDYEHHEVHGGDMFTIDWYPGDINAAASAVLFMETPNTSKWAHMVYEVETENEATVYIWEGASYNTSGTAVTPLNKNRNSSTASTVFAHYTPNTPATGGTLIRTRHWGSGKAVGGQERNLNEIILKKGTKYAFIVVNNSTGAAWVDMIFNWYEHTDVT